MGLCYPSGMELIIRFAALFGGIGLIKAIARDSDFWSSLGYVSGAIVFGGIFGLIFYAAPLLRRRIGS